jgi:hypothetical protein
MRHVMIGWLGWHCPKTIGRGVKPFAPDAPIWKPLLLRPELVDHTRHRSVASRASFYTDEAVVRPPPSLSTSTTHWWGTLLSRLSAEVVVVGPVCRPELHWSLPRTAAPHRLVKPALPMSAAIAAVPLPVVAIAVVAPAFPMSQPPRCRRRSAHAKWALAASWPTGVIGLRIVAAGASTPSEHW